MNCQYEKYINDMLYGKLDADKEIELRKHAESCSECSMKLKEIEDIDKTIKEAVTYSAYNDFKQDTLQAVKKNKGFTGFRVFLYKVRPYIYALAAILLIAVSLYLYNSLMNVQKPAGTNPTKTEDKSSDIKIESIDENKIEGDEKIIREFRSHQGYSKEELNKLDIKPLGTIDAYDIYYVPFKDKTFGSENWSKDGCTFPIFFNTRIIGVKSNRAYTLGNLLFETKIDVKKLYQLLPEDLLEEHKNDIPATA